MLIIAAAAISVLIGYAISAYQLPMVAQAIIAITIFAITFVKTEFGLYILIFSMLLSPQFMAGHTAGSSLGRGVTLRFEDFLLIVIGMSWLAKNAVFKELGLFLRTPINKGIFFYAVACILSTGFGIMAGRVDPKTGFFFVLKYIEYFVIFFMMVNHVENEEQLKRFAFCLFLTCLIVSIIGILQIPGGGRVSAPFEGQQGEPNTFGGYLVFTGAIAAGIAFRLRKSWQKTLLFVVLVVLLAPLLYTQSRSSYLAALPAILILAWFSEKRQIVIGLVVIGILLSPFLMPSVVRQRILYTFEQPVQSGQIDIGRIRLDTSTSARLKSWAEAISDWTKHPIFGYGVTGYKFIDAQYPRVLNETGIIGALAFFYLLFSIFQTTITSLRQASTEWGKGMCIGFLAGFGALLFHAIGANTFIIVRIMEPFWFFAGMVTVLPAVEQGELLSKKSPAGERHYAT